MLPCPRTISWCFLLTIVAAPVRPLSPHCYPVNAVLSWIVWMVLDFQVNFVLLQTVCDQFCQVIKNADSLLIPLSHDIWVTTDSCNIIVISIPNTTLKVTATNIGVKETNTLDIWTFQTQQLRLQLLLNKSIAMPDLQLIRDLARKVRVYGAVLHLRWSQIARIPAIVVDDWLAETR